MKRIFSIFMVILFFPALAGKVDSLKTELSKTIEVEKRIETLLQLSYEYQLINPDTAYIFVRKAIDISKQFEVKKFDPQLMTNYADILVLHDSLDKAFNIYNDAKALFRKSGDLITLSKLYLVCANLYLTNNNYASALSEYTYGLKIADSLNNTMLMAHFYNNIGGVYLSVNNQKKALKNYNEALKYFNSIKDTLNIGMTYSNISICYAQTDQIDLAFEYLEKAENLIILQKNNIRLAEVYSSFSDLYYTKKNYNLALDYAHKADSCLNSDIVDYLGPKSVVQTSVYLSLGRSFFNKSLIDSAKYYLEKCLKISVEKGFYKVSAQASHELAKVYESIGSKNEALKYFKMYMKYSELDQNDHKLRQLANKELENAIEQQKKLQQIETLKQKNIQTRNYWLFLSAVLTFILVSVILFLLYRLEKNKRMRIMESRKSMKTELEYKNKEMATFVLYLMKKNELVLETSKKLKRMILTSDSNRRILREIISSLDTDSMTDLGEEFDKRFKEVHTGFYKNLSKDFPGLTTSELRLSAFLRLNMNTKDISAITYQSANSITVARHRLRQKFGLTKEDSLAGFLSKY